MSKIHIHVKVKFGLKNSITKKKYNLDDGNNMITMEGHIFEVLLWNEKDESVKLKLNHNGCIYIFDISDVINIDDETLLPLFPKPKIFNPNKLDI